jgi:hypothetical protein
MKQNKFTESPDKYVSFSLACVAGSLGLGKKTFFGEGAREGEPAVMPRYFSFRPLHAHITLANKIIAEVRIFI